MNLTNKHGLPEVLVRAVQNDTYNRGDCDFTVTELLGPPRQRRLQKLHDSDLVEDVADRLWSLYGQIGHGILERAQASTEIAEQRFYAKYGGFTVSAQIDTLVLLKGILTDWKFTTSYKFIAGKPKPWEYLWQLNMQRDILIKNGLTVNELEVCGLLRDWQVSKARYDKLYPQTSIAIMPIEIFPQRAVEDFIMNRIQQFKSAEDVLPECTKDETWSGRRCSDYCNVSSWCSQYKERKK